MVKGSARGKIVAVTKKKAGKEEAQIGLIPMRYRLARPKFIRDPIHDLIRFEDKTVLAILDTPPMQRLKGIKQLGAASFVYPGAEHSRFSHSLGVYHIASKILAQIRESRYYNRLVIQLAALLHDTGHGPFSHLFEAALKEYGYRHYEKHEAWTKRIVMEHPDVVKILDNRSKKLKQAVTDVISGSFKPLYLSSIVSSQVDADRFDYMLRDSHMTGVHYGKFDLNWMLRNLSVRTYEERDEDNQEHAVEKIVVDARRGLSSLETYLLGNFYLYKHVYYHKTIEAAENMLIKILKRAFYCSQNKRRSGGFDPVLRKIAKHKRLLLPDYLSLTDATITSWIIGWAYGASDTILRDLCLRLLKRELFKVVHLGAITPPAYAEMLRKAEPILQGKHLDPEYYLIEGDPKRVAYKNLFVFRSSEGPNQEIYYLDEDDKVKPLTNIAKEHPEHTISAAIQDLKLDEYFLVVPEECVTDIETIKERVLR